MTRGRRGATAQRLVVNESRRVRLSIAAIVRVNDFDGRIRDTNNAVSDWTIGGAVGRGDAVVLQHLIQFEPATSDSWIGDRHCNRSSDILNLAVNRCARAQI